MTDDFDESNIRTSRHSRIRRWDYFPDGSDNEDSDKNHLSDQVDEQVGDSAVFNAQTAMRQRILSSPSECHFL